MQKTDTILLKDPFRLFFPLGIVFSVLGVFPWLGFRNFFPYSVQLHKTLMINGFLLSFVCGFLLTAIPRFTSTQNATFKEVVFICLVLLSNVIAAFLQYWGVHYFFVGATICGVIYFARRRFKYRKANPPYTFLFVGISLLIWMVSSLIIFISEFINIGQAAHMSQNLVNRGVVLGLIYGVGGRLIPGILGWTQIVEEQKELYERPIPFYKTVPPEILVCITLFFGSFTLDYFAQEWMGPFMRSAVALFFALKFWKIHRFPKVKSFLTWSLWSGAWFLVGGEILLFFFPQLGVNGAHIIFIGGFSLITLSIATRVTRAHSQLSQTFESNSKLILFFAILIIATMIIRISVYFLPQFYLSNLMYAVIAWLAAVFMWLWGIGRYLIKK